MDTIGMKAMETLFNDLLRVLGQHKTVKLCIIILCIRGKSLDSKYA